MPLKGLLLSAGAGAVVAAASFYLVKKAKKFFRSSRPKMRLIQNSLLLSTRCAWFISELDAEGDFQISIDENFDFSSECLLSELEALPYTETQSSRRLLRQEQDYQVVEYSPSNSQEDLRLCVSDSNSDYGSQDSSKTPSMTACVINDEFTLIEGAAICMYLADLYGQFLPEEEHRAEYYSWIVYSAATFDNIVKTLHMQLVEIPIAERNSQLLESALSGFNAFARALTETLSSKKYLCGKNFTAADCVLGFTLWWASTINDGRLLDRHHVLRAYLSRLTLRPAFQKTLNHQGNSSLYMIAYTKDN